MATSPFPVPDSPRIKTLVSGCYFVDALEHLLHSAAATKHTFDRRLFYFSLFDDAVDRLEYLLVVEGFGNVIHGAFLHRVYCGRDASVAGHDENWRGSCPGDNVRARRTRQPQICDDQIDLSSGVASVSSTEPASVTL